MSHTHEIAWAAGFFDGEGFVSIQERNHKEYTGYYLRIGVNHVAPEPLYELLRLFGGTVVKDTKLPIGNRKQRHRWVTSTRNAANCLQQMLPYMRNKNKVTALALDFQRTIQEHKKEVPEEVQRYRANCKEEMQRLNSLD